MADSQGLRGKGLVGLDEVHISNLHIQLLHQLIDSGNGAYTHDGGIYAAQSAANPGSHRLNAQLLGLLFAHYYDGGSAVIDTGSVAGGDDAVLLEGGLQAGQGLHSGAGTGTLIGINDHRALLALDLYGNDLVLELALSHSLFALLLAVGGELIEHFAGQVPLLGNIFGSDAHVIVIESIPQGVIYHGIYQGSIAHAVAVTALHHGVGGERHALHTAGYYDIGIASLDHLSGHIDTVQTGTADDIDGNGGGGHRQASLQGSLTGDILAQTSLDNAAHVNMVDLLGGNAGAVQGLLDNDGTEFSGGNGAESTAHGADGGTAGACQNDFLHKCVPP